MGVVAAVNPANVLGRGTWALGQAVDPDVDGGGEHWQRHGAVDQHRVVEALDVEGTPQTLFGGADA